MAKEGGPTLETIECPSETRVAACVVEEDVYYVSRGRSRNLVATTEVKEIGITLGNSVLFMSPECRSIRGLSTESVNLK